MAIMNNREYYPKYFYDQNQKRYLYCEKCDLEMTHDMEHCDECQVCVEHYDHHCIFYSKCIAGGNIYSFWAAFGMLMVNFMAIVGIIIVYPDGMNH